MDVWNQVSTPLIPAVVDRFRCTATWMDSTQSSRGEWMDRSTSTETGTATLKASETQKESTGWALTDSTALRPEQHVQN